MASFVLTRARVRHLVSTIATAVLLCQASSAEGKPPVSATTTTRAPSPALAAGPRPAQPTGVVARSAPIRVSLPPTPRTLPALGSRPQSTPATSQVFAAVTRAAVRYPSTTSTVATGGNRIVKWPLVDDDQIGQAMHDLITGAHKEVFVETMILKDSRIAERVRDAVQELARTRPDVRVYIRFTPRPTEIAWFARRSVEKFFNSPNVVVGAWKSRDIGPRSSIQRLAGANVSHAKTVVVDNRVALITDTNLQPESDPPKGWFQNGIVVEGPIAATIREQSADAWRLAAPHVALPAPPPAHPGFAHGIPMLTLGQHEIGGALTSANQAYLAAFNNAERRVYILTPNLNDPETMEALARATAKAEVDIILPKGFNQRGEALPREGGGNEANVHRLAQMAANASNLHVRWNPDPEGKPSQGNGDWASHAKTILVDDVLFIGSKNLDTQSAHVSRELSIAFPDRAAAQRFHDVFQARWERAPVAFDSATPLPPVVAPTGAMATATRVVRDVARQVGGVSLGLGEKALGRFDPDFTGGYVPIEVKDPTGARGVVIYRSNQPKTVADIARLVDLAKQRGVTDPAKITIINLRSEKSEDRQLIARYAAAGGGGLRAVDVKMLDNAPPAFYLGPLGWNHAVDKIRQVYQALKSPSTKFAVIHCEEGEGRTGEVVATAVRIAMDKMSVGDALAEARALGLTMPWQRMFIERFAREWEAGRIRFE